MKKFRRVILYTALALFANTATAADVERLESLREDSMRKLIFVADPELAADPGFTDAGGAAMDMAGFRGKYLLVNFWATWCAPCREEMPALDALQAEFGGDDFAVLPIATGPNPLPAIEKFYTETGLENLGVYLDPRQVMAREMAVLALPITVLIDPEGREIARLRGDAEWYSDSARAIIAALLE